MPTPATPSWSRLQASSAGVKYHCAMCGTHVGALSDVRFTDKFDRVYCSEACYSEARRHPSWDYEVRGGDY